MSKGYDYFGIIRYDECGESVESLGTDYEAEAVREAERIVKKGDRAVLSMSVGRGEKRRWRGYLVPQGASRYDIEDVVRGNKTPKGMTPSKPFPHSVSVPPLVDDQTCARKRRDDRWREMFGEEFGAD